MENVDRIFNELLNDVNKCIIKFSYLEDRAKNIINWIDNYLVVFLYKNI